MTPERFDRLMRVVLVPVGILGMVCSVTTMNSPFFSGSPGMGFLMGFAFMANLVMALGNLGPKTREVVIAYAVMVAVIAAFTGSVAHAAISVAVLLLVGAVCETIVECRERAKDLSEMRRLRRNQPGRRGVTYKHPSRALRLRGARQRVTFCRR